MDLLTLEHFAGCMNERFRAALQDGDIEFTLVEAQPLPRPPPGALRLPLPLTVAGDLSTGKPGTYWQSCQLTWTIFLKSNSPGLLVDVLRHGWRLRGRAPTSGPVGCHHPKTST